MGNVCGKDKVVRGLKVKLGNGHILERPLKIVCNFEVGGEDQAMKMNPLAEVCTTRKGIKKSKAGSLGSIKGSCFYMRKMKTEQ